MKPSTSIIIKTNRKERDTSFTQWKKKLSQGKIQQSLLWEDKDQVFENNIMKSRSFIEPTLRSLTEQEYDDFEVVLVYRGISHKTLELANSYRHYLNLKIVPEKHSIWHELGDEYCTISNAINTGIIYADGELLISTDDCSIFPPKLVGEMANLYFKKMKYSIPPYIKYSLYNPAKSNLVQEVKISANKLDGYTKMKDKWEIHEWDDNAGLLKETTLYNKKPGDIFYPTYGYCFSVSLEEALYINGFDETYDGAMHGEDGDFGERLSVVSPYKRVVTENKIYFFGHKYSNVKNYKLVRDNRKFKEFIGQRPYPPDKIVANIWRPTQEQLNAYREWHLKMYGQLDPNWDKCKNVPLFRLKSLRKRLRTIGKL